MKTTSLLLPLLAAAYVSAHGFLSTLTINGKAFKGNVPGGNKSPSVIRQVTSPSPNKGATNQAITCGASSTPGSLVADANPGDTVTFDWRGADQSRWPHNTGPMLTYMASCGSKSCDKFDISQAKWFKIQQLGQKGGNWAQADLMNGGVATATIPPTLAPGNYLIRHEIIALHLANSLGGAEFYPACAQLRVGGSQTGAPKASELVSLPGAYSDNDPGIFDQNVFQPGAKYVFPGPAVASFVSGTATDDAPPPSNTSPANPPSGNDKANDKGKGQGKGKGKSAKTCKVRPPKKQQKRDSKEDCELETYVRPRNLSRVMRKLAFDQLAH
jgi:hypothetical protein